MPKRPGEKLKARRALVVYLTIGDPLVWNKEVVRALTTSGVDLFELGVPTTMAKYDGPSIRASYRRALRSGVDEKRAILLIKEVDGLFGSILFMYYDVALVHGLENLMSSIAETGIKCVLFPDLLIDYPESLEDYMKLCEKYDLEPAFFITSCFPHRFITRLAGLEPAFIYLGLMPSSGTLLPIAISRNIRIIKGLIGEVPLLVGFALSNPQQVSLCVRAGADGVVVGSAILNVLVERGFEVTSIKSFISNLRGALLEGR
jgi:tryptophan synthase alpha chain